MALVVSVMIYFNPLYCKEAVKGGHWHDYPVTVGITR